MDNMEDDITNAMNELNLGRGQAPRKELKTGLLEHGDYNKHILSDVVAHIKATKGDYDRISVEDVIKAYRTKVSSFSVDCEYCRGGGWLKVILLNGFHDGREKTWIYNYRDPAKHRKYLAANPTFKAFGSILPCTCENGDNRNVKNKREWYGQEMRGLFLVRSIRWKGDPDAASGAEDYWQSQTIEMLNGKIEAVKDLKEFPSVDILKVQLMQTLSEVE